MTYNAYFFINTHSMKKASLLIVLLLISLAVSAQVSFSAHVFLPKNEPLDDFSPFYLKVDGEEWWADTTADLFTLWEQQYQENVYAHDYTLGIADEKSLCYPIAADGTMRLLIDDPLGWGVLIYRVEGDQLYRKRVSAYYDEIKENEFYTLPDVELDSVTMAVDAFRRAGRPDDESGVFVIDGNEYLLEYTVNGHYYRYKTSSGAVPSQLESLINLLGRIYKRSLPSITPIQVTNVMPDKEFDCSYATVYACKSDTLTIGYLLIPKEDEKSMQIFNNSVSKDLWGDAVGISPKRFVPDLVDVQQAEVVLAEVMRDEVIPRMEPYYRNIGNLENYTKYERTYGFYYNEKEEKCVYIQMELLEPFPRLSVGFMEFWDSCDYNVYINLNLEKHEVIRAYPSTCQGY